MSTSTSAQVDPYKVLNLPKTFTMDQLKEAYKKMALKVHPDKGGNEYMFKLVTACYKTLAKEYNRRVSDRQYHELKADFVKSQSQHQRRMDNINLDAATKGFNLERFNRVFEENKLPSITDTGYETFLKDSKEVEQKNMFAGKKFSREMFNKQFEKHATTLENNKFVVKYKEPEPLLATKKMSYVELGEESIDDFSGANTSRKNLNYMDLKLAHTTSRIIDLKAVDKRREYKTVEDLENDRSSISYTMNDEDRIYYERKRKQEELMERQRMATVLKTDQQTALQFDKIHRMLLGRSAN